MAIKLLYEKTSRDLTGCSKMWGNPDLPDSLDYPEVEVKDDGETYFDPMTFICQIRLEDIAALDREGKLPHRGMLYFFASLDYFLGNIYAPCSPGMGEWDSRYFKVLYTEDGSELHTHRIVYDDGSEYGLPALALSFEECGDRDYGFKLLGEPYFEEVRDLYPGRVSLLQLDCEDDWGLRFFDCGMLNFLMDGKSGIFRKDEESDNCQKDGESGIFRKDRESGHFREDGESGNCLKNGELGTAGNGAERISCYLHSF